jgi:hypothetical protein
VLVVWYSSNPLLCKGFRKFVEAAEVDTVGNGREL